MKTVALVTILGLIGVVYYGITFSKTVNNRIENLSNKIDEQLIEKGTRKDRQKIATPIIAPPKSKYRFTYTTPVRIDLFELGTKVISLGSHHVCYLTGINESGGPDSACYISSDKNNRSWQLEIINAICSAQCINLVEVSGESD